MTARILSDDDWVDAATPERKTHIKPSSSASPPSSISSARLNRAPQKQYGNNGSSTSNNNINNNNNSNGSFSYNYVKSTYNLGNSSTGTSNNQNPNNNSSSSSNSNSNSNTMNGIRSHPANRDSRHGAYGFFSSGQNTHHFESYLSRKGHQDVQPSHQVKPAPDRERVSVPLPEGTGKPEGVWNAFNGNYTQQDWANYARGQAAPAAKRPANTATAATVRTNAPTTTLTVASRHAQAQKPSLLTSTAPAPAPASPGAPSSSSSCSSSTSLSSTSKLPAAPMASPPLRSPTPLIDLEFGSTLPATPTGNSTLPATPTVNSSIFADLLDLDFTDCVSTTSTTTTTTTTATAAAAAAAITTTADTGTDTPKDSTGTEKAAVPVEESTLIDFSDSSAGTVPDRASSLSASSESFGEAGQSDDHLAADGYTTGNSDYNDDDSDSDSGDDDDDHHRQLGFDKGLENEKDSESNTKGIFVDFETLANLRTELLDANVTWEDLLTRLKGGRA